MKAKITEVLDQYADRLVCVYLFGSQARNDARSDSDVDLGVVLRTDPEPTLQAQGFDIADAVQEAIGRPVDLVVLNRASPDLIHRVLRDGDLLLEIDRSARVRFEVRARNEYFDMLPYINEYRSKTGTANDGS